MRHRRQTVDAGVTRSVHLREVAKNDHFIAEAADDLSFGNERGLIRSLDFFVEDRHLIAFAELQRIKHDDPVSIRQPEHRRTGKRIKNFQRIPRFGTEILIFGEFANDADVFRQIAGADVIRDERGKIDVVAELPEKRLQTTQPARIEIFLHFIFLFLW